LKNFVFYRRLSPLAHSLISDSKRHHNSLLNFFFCDRRLSPLAHLGQFSYFSYDRKMMRKTFQESIQMILP
jgi:hypothetical protein